jgi:glycosyltransferase involved in cell wall biosynthesis
MKLSVVIPVYNEAKTIIKILENIKQVDLNKEIIIVDDFSTDGTREILNKINENGIKIYYHSKNMGKGAAVRTGFQYITGDIVVIQDADLEYDPQEYFSLMDPIKKGFADVVYGTRLGGGKPQRVYMFWHKVGNRFITLIANVLYNNTLTDIETCYKMFKAEVVKGLKLHSNGFSIEPELTAKIFKNDYKVYEIPISYYGRTYKEGKKICWIHGFEAIWTLIKYRFVN